MPKNKIVQISTNRKEAKPDRKEAKPDVVKHLIKKTSQKINLSLVSNDINEQNFEVVKTSHLERENEILNSLRKRAARIITTVRVKFDLDAFRTNMSPGSKWYSSTKVTKPDTKACLLKFSSSDLAKDAKSYLYNEFYDVTLVSDRELSVSLVKTPEEVKLERHEKTSEQVKATNLVEELQEVIGKARTAHLTPEMIITRIWDALVKNNIILVDKTKKITMENIIAGCNIFEDKEVFTIIVNEALT